MVKLKLFEKMKLVECSNKYWGFVRTLRNDERVLDGFIESTYITPKMQTKYMNKYSDCYRICIIETHVGDTLIKNPVGFVGVIDDDIRICTHPEYQGKGVGKFMLKKIMEIFPTAYGKVKIDNETSKKLFSSLGFKKKFIIFEHDGKN